MEPVNILFIIAFVGLPIAIGVWALVTRREVLQRRLTSRRRIVNPPQLEEQPTMQVPEVQHGPRAQETIEIRGTETTDQATVQVPRHDWKSQVQSVRGQTRQPVAQARRRFYPPRYVGRSGGVVKRVTPRAARSFLRLRSSSPR